MIQTTLWADKVVPAAVSRDILVDSREAEADSITSSRVRADKEASSNSSSGMVSRLRIPHTWLYTMETTSISHNRHMECLCSVTYTSSINVHGDIKAYSNDYDSVKVSIRLNHM
jgi:hypothetical protein